MASGSTFKDVNFSDLDHALFKRNIKAIRRVQPNLGKELDAVKETYSTLVVNEEGEYDIRFRGTRLYDVGHKEWAGQRMDNYHNKPGVKRLHMSPVDSDNLDDESSDAAYRLMRRAVNADIQFLTNPNDLLAFHVIVLGIGLGGHIEALAEATEARNLILVEPNMEFLYWSCYVFDWDAFYKDARKKRRRVIILSIQNPVNIMESCISHVRVSNPAFVDGLLFFHSYNSSVMTQAHELMMNSRDLFNIGLGFIEDEIDMIRNSYRNLENFEGRYFEPHTDEVAPLPTFVIGAGPSLDNDLEFIRENQDRVLIISCGTALRVLLNNGITPDFQMEMENVTAVTDLMTNLSKTFDLSGIKLVASNTADPGVKNFFDETVFYIRSGLSSYQIFKLNNHCSIPYSTPTVSNLGFAFALSIGCRDIYMFGVDLGARDPNKHHAADAAYNTGELEFTTTMNDKNPGNLGGEVSTEKVYLWSKNTLEQAMKRFPNHNYVNCSDGMLIEGSLPKLSSTIELKPFEDKAAVVKEVIDRFPRYNRDLFKSTWNRYDLREAMRKETDKVLRKCYRSTSEKSKNEHLHDLEFLFNVTKGWISGDDDEPAEINYLRGSGFMLMSLMTFYYARIPSAEKKKVFAEICRDEFSHMMRYIRDTMIEFYDYVECKIEQDGKYEAREP